MAQQEPWFQPANCTLIARTAITRSTRQGHRQVSWPVSCAFVLERVTRIELALSAWEADVLPLNYTRRRAAGRRNAASWLALPAYRIGTR
jgi:hypothetical protein